MNNFTIEKFKELAQRIIEKNSKEIEIKQGCDLYLLLESPNENDLRNKYQNSYYVLKSENTINFYYVNQPGLKKEISIDENFNYLLQGLTSIFNQNEPCNTKISAEQLAIFENMIIKNLGFQQVNFYPLKGKKRAYMTYIPGEIQGEMEDILRNSINLPEWSFEHFLSLISGFLYKEILKNNIAHCEKIGFNLEDCKKSIDDVIQYYQLELEKINEKVNISEDKRPSEWLSLAQGNKESSKIHPLIVKLITYQHFDLTEIEAEKGKSTNSVPLTPEKAAAFLNEKLETERYGSSDMPALCMKSSFNAYVKLPSKPASKRKIVDTTITNIAKIESAIENDTIDKNYKYHYDGLFRLNKEILENSDGPIRYFDHHSENDRWISQQTVKYLRDGGEIQINRRNNRFYFQPSLSQYILGVNPFFEPDLPSTGERIITADKLLYLEDELIEFIEKKENAYNQFLIKTSEPEIRKKRSSPAIHNVIKLAYDGETKELGRNATTDEVFEAIRKDYKTESPQYDKEGIVLKVINNEITWRKQNGKEKSIQFKTVDNFLRKYKKINNPVLS